jgi:hypothetical protein
MSTTLATLVYLVAFGVAVAAIVGNGGDRRWEGTGSWRTRSPDTYTRVPRLILSSGVGLAGMAVLTLVLAAAVRYGNDAPVGLWSDPVIQGTATTLGVASAALLAVYAVMWQAGADRSRDFIEAEDIFRREVEVGLTALHDSAFVLSRAWLGLTGVGLAFAGKAVKRTLAERGSLVLPALPLDLAYLYSPADAPARPTDWISGHAADLMKSDGHHVQRCRDLAARVRDLLGAVGIDASPVVADAELLADLTLMALSPTDELGWDAQVMFPALMTALYGPSPERVEQAELALRDLSAVDVGRVRSQLSSVDAFVPDAELAAAENGVHVPDRDTGAGRWSRSANDEKAAWVLVCGAPWRRAILVAELERFFDALRQPDTWSQLNVPHSRVAMWRHLWAKIEAPERIPRSHGLTRVTPTSVVLDFDARLVD